MNEAALVNQRSKYTLVGILAVILWASSLPFIKRCSEDLGPFTTGFFQFFSGGVIGLFVNRFIFTRDASTYTFLKKRQFYYRVILFSIYFSLFYSAIGAVSRNDLPVLILLNYLWPTFMMLLSVHILNQPCNKIILFFGSIIVLLGLSIEILGERFFEILTTPQSWPTLVACTQIITAAFCWGLYAVMNRKWGSLAGEVRGLPFAMLLGSLVLLILRFLYDEKSTFTTGALFPLCYLMVSPYIGNLCWDIGTRKGNIIVLSLIADSLPWASLTITSIYLAVSIGMETWISAVVIVVGALISRYALLVKAKDV